MIFWREPINSVIYGCILFIILFIMEKLTKDLISQQPSTAADLIANMLSDWKLTKNERAEILSVLDTLKSSKESIINETIKNLKNFADKNWYIWFAAKIASDSLEFQQLPLRMQTPADYLLSEWTSATFFSEINDKWEDYKKKYINNPDSLISEEKILLSKYLIEKAQTPSNSRFYMVDDYILAAKINPESYKNIAKNEILKYVENNWWNKDVVSNLEKIWLNKDEIKTEILRVTSKVTWPNEHWLATSIEATIPCLVQLWLTQELDRLQNIVSKIWIKWNYDPLRDFIVERSIQEEYWTILHWSWRLSQNEWLITAHSFQIKRNWEIYTVLFIDKNTKKEIKWDHISSSEIEEFLKNNIA